MALPAIRDVARSRPNERLAVAARPTIAPLFTLVPEVGEIVVLERAGSAGVAAARRLRDERFEAALLLPNSFQSALTAWRANIPERWGYRAQGRTPLLTRGIAMPQHRVHQTAFYQRLTEALGFPKGPSTPRLDMSHTIREEGASLLAAAGWDGRSPLMAIAPGAAHGTAKRWPAESFAALVEELAADGVTSVLVGSAADAVPGNSVVRRIRSVGVRPISLIGRTDLPALAGVLGHCRALVSNDSGAMHFGAALGVPLVAIFGPTNERETRPVGPHDPVVLIHPVWCRPCMLRECPLTHRCMRGVSVDAVLSAVRQPS
jgi:heptosyltransferase-2